MVQAQDARRHLVEQRRFRLAAKQHLPPIVPANGRGSDRLARSKHRWARCSTLVWLQLDSPKTPPRPIALSPTEDSSRPKSSTQRAAIVIQSHPPDWDTWLSF